MQKLLVLYKSPPKALLITMKHDQKMNKKILLVGVKRNNNEGKKMG